MPVWKSWRQKSSCQSVSIIASCKPEARRKYIFVAWTSLSSPSRRARQPDATKNERKKKGIKKKRRRNERYSSQHPGLGFLFGAWTNRELGYDHVICKVGGQRLIPHANLTVSSEGGDSSLAIDISLRSAPRPPPLTVFAVHLQTQAYQQARQRQIKYIHRLER